MAKAETKPSGLNVVLTLSEYEASLIQEVFGNCVDWSSCEGAEDLCNTLDALDFERTNFRTEYSEVDDMFIVEKQ